jgi:CTP:molybdopterin cytidylyltransferase MocA
VIAVVLAAGRGSRLGGVAKALLPFEGESFLARVAGTVAAAGGGEILVVVGPPHGGAVRAEAARLGLAVVENPAPERGMGSSVAAGFTALAGRDAPAALLWPVDVARVAAPTVAAVVAVATPGRIVVPTFRGRGGHPAAFGRDLWEELAGCDLLPEGARTILHRDPARVTRLPVDDPFVLADVDVPADLERGP